MGGANAQPSIVDGQVELFLFDLKNEAIEHGFKAGESWNLRIATDKEIISLKKEHHPVISLRLQRENLLKAYLQVKRKLEQPVNNSDMALTDDDLAADEKRHLAAFPARNIRG